jgi:PAS domain S-box-containing protein
VPRSGRTCGKDRPGLSRKGKRLRLLHRALVLVGISLVPAVLIQASNEWQARSALTAELRASAEREAAAAAGDVAQLFETVRQLLVTLSYVQSVREADLDRCNPLFRTVTLQDPNYLNVATAGADGTILCSAVPPAAGITARGRPYFRALDTRTFTVGEYTVGLTIRIPIIQLSYPMLDDKGIANGVIWVAMRLDRLQAHLERRLLPPHAALMVVDRNGTVLARVPEGAELRGRELPPPLRQAIETAQPGTVEAVGLDGDERIFGFVPVAAAQGVTVLAGIDRQAVLAQIATVTWRGTGLILAGLVLSLMVAVLGSRHVLLKPIEGLAAAADAWRQGNFTIRVSMPEESSELGRLGVAFNTMAEELAARDSALRASSERLRLAVEATGIGTWDVDPATGERRWSDEFKAILGLPPDATAAFETFEALIHPEDRDWVNEHYRAAYAAGNDGRYMAEFRIRRAGDGAERRVLATGRVHLDAQGRPIRGIGTLMDLTDRRRMEERLRESEERYRTLVEMSPDAVYVHQDDVVTLANRQAAVLLGAAEPGELIGRSVYEWVSEESLALARMRMARLMTPGMRNEPVEMTFRRLDGSPIQVEAASAAVLVDGRLAVLVTLRDITERKAAEARQRLLLAELSHRVKNTLAVVQSIASQSLADGRTLEGGRAAFRRRLQALARTHDLLTRSRWQGVRLHALVEGELGPYGRQARSAGADILLTARAAQTLGLVLHELATNAAKHGALSTPRGVVDLAWEVTADAVLRLRWRELGGPAVRPPARRGFGRTMIEQALAHDLGGRAQLVFAPAGIACELELPLNAVSAPVQLRK